MAAQQVRGVVVANGLNAAVPGAVVALVDSSGRTASRTISDAGGRFALTLAPHAAKVHVIRIGFRPADVELPSGGAPSITVMMDRLPPMLDAVRVTGNELCPGGPAQGSAFQVWEQVRAGLLATIVAREANPAQATTLSFENQLDPREERVEHQTKKFKSGQTTRPFVASAPPEVFAQRGYMREVNNVRTYTAPDADVLVDETFAATHCFHLQAADRAHEGQIGLAFVPTPNRDTLVDVKGVIWVDLKNPELRSYDFLYTSLEPASMKKNAGGNVQFRSMPNGVAFIERWHFRLPVLEAVPDRVAVVMREGMAQRRDRTDLRVGEIVETGGVVVHAEWTDGNRWDDPPSTLRGTVVEKKSSRPIANAIVALDGTPDSTRTNANGEFEIKTIPAKYVVWAVDTTFSVFSEPRIAKNDVEIKHGETTVTRFELASLRSVIDELCHDQPHPDQTVMLMGVAAFRDRPLPPKAMIQAHWQSNFAGVEGGAVTVKERTQTVKPDKDGRFVACGVANERPVDLRLSIDGAFIADTTVKVFTKGYSQNVLWLVDPTKGPAAARP